MDELFEQCIFADGAISALESIYMLLVYEEENKEVEEENGINSTINDEIARRQLLHYEITEDLEKLATKIAQLA